VAVCISSINCSLFIVPLQILLEIVHTHAVL
jgi:hypothetical protein